MTTRKVKEIKNMESEHGDFFNNFCKNEFTEIKKTLIKIEERNESSNKEIIEILKGNGKAGVLTDIALIKQQRIHDEENRKRREEDREKETKKRDRKTLAVFGFVTGLITTLINIAARMFF